MTQLASRGAARRKRHDRIRLHLAGTEARPRLAVFRSLNHIYAQVIDDASGKTLAAASTVEKEQRSSKATKTEEAAVVGLVLGRGERGEVRGIHAEPERRFAGRGHGHEPPSGVAKGHDQVRVAHLDGKGPVAQVLEDAHGEAPPHHQVEDRRHDGRRGHARQFSHERADRPRQDRSPPHARQRHDGSVH